MLVKSEGCPLHHIKYRDNGLIVYTYTRDFGFQTLLVQGVRRKKGTGNPSIYQPLFLLDIDFYYHQSQDIHRIKEARLHTAYHAIPFNVYKSSMVLFLAEILYKCLRTQEISPALYDFISHAMQILDKMDTGTSNFHLVFLIKLSRHLGFYPNPTDAHGIHCFDLRDGIFRKAYPNHPCYMPEKYASILLDLLSVDFNSMDRLPMNQTDRNVMVEHILEYYQLHQENLKNVQSYKIFRKLFN